MLQAVAHADVNQETDCGLMFVSHFDMQTLQEQDSQRFHFQFKTRDSEPVFSTHCGLLYSSKERGLHTEKRERTPAHLWFRRNQTKWGTFCSVLFCHSIKKNMSFNFFKWGCHVHFIVFCKYQFVVRCLLFKMYLSAKLTNILKFLVCLFIGETLQFMS